MLVKRIKKYPNNLLCKETKNVTYVWSSDGWLYIPELRIRRKYRETPMEDVFDVIQEQWSGVIFLGEYTEKVFLRIYSDSPQVWEETSDSFSELYGELTPSSNTSK